MSLSVYLLWEGMDEDAQEAAIRGRYSKLGTSEQRGWNVGYAGYLHDFNGMGTAAGTLVRDWFREPACEVPLEDVPKLCRNLPAALRLLYGSDYHETFRVYRVGMLTGFAVRAVELHAAGSPIRIFAW